MRRLKRTKKAKTLRGSWMQRRDLQKWSLRMENSWPTNLNTPRILSGKKLTVTVLMCEKKKSVSLPCDSRQKRANRQHTCVVRSLAIVLEILRQQIRLSVTNRTASPAQTRFDLLFPLFDKADQPCLVSMFLFTDLIHSRKISLLENIITGVHVIDSFSVGSSRLHKRNFSIPFSRMYFLNVVN